MHKCGCCGKPTYAVANCSGCDDDCDPVETWHCFTGHCDGSGCSYSGECQGLPHPVRSIHPMIYIPVPHRSA
jgi:hypothetical protein